jgi:hypothetical protein
MQCKQRTPTWLSLAFLYLSRLQPLPQMLGRGFR